MHNNFLAVENHATRFGNNKMANKNLVLVAVSLLALFAIAAVPADAFTLNFTVTNSTGGGVSGAFLVATLQQDRNTLAQTEQNVSISGSRAGDAGRANLTISDGAANLWNIRILYNSTTVLTRNLAIQTITGGQNWFGGFFTHTNVPLPALPAAAWLTLVPNTTSIRLVNALNIHMIAFNSTSWAVENVLPNGTIFNGTHIFVDPVFNGTNNYTNVTYANGTKHNSTVAGTSFSYLIMDRDKGVPIAYSIANQTAVPAGRPTNHFMAGQVAAEVLPLQKNYTVMLYTQTGESPPRFMDIINPATNTSLNISGPALAKGGASVASLTAADADLDNVTFAIGVAMNFTTTVVNVNGSIFLPMYGNTTGGVSGGSGGSNYGGTGGSYITITNITAIPYVNSFAFVRGYQRGTQPNAPIIWSATVGTNLTIEGLNYSIWTWNISLPTQTSWILMASAANDTTGSYMLGITNVTVGTAPVVGLNFTMKQIYNYSVGGGTGIATNISRSGNGSNSPPVNLNMTQLQIVDGDTNATLTGVSYVVIELNTNTSQRTGAFDNWTGHVIKVKFAMETSSVGRVAFPFFVNESAKVTAYTGRHAPKEFVLTPDTLAANETINLTVYQFRPRVPGAAGGEIGGFKSDQFIENLEISIMGNNDTCNRISVNVPAGCTISSVNQPQLLNPLAGLFGGQKVSVRIRSLDKGHIIHYYGVDMGGGGVPEVQFDPVAEDRSAGAADLVFKIGARLPKNTYEGIFVGIPYGSTIDETENINASIATLYDTNWNPVWNVTQNGTPLDEQAAYVGKFNTTDFTDWNLSMIANRSLGGVICSKTNGGPGFACLANTTEDMMWLRLPHFSGSGVGAVGVKAASTATASTGTSGGGGSGGAGGGAAGGTSQSFVSTTVTAQAPVSNDVTKSEIGITQVEYTLSENANSVKLEVSKLADKPADIASSPSGTAYSYVSITLTGVDTSKVSSGKVKFTVDKSWVTDNSADVNSVKLNRWNGAAWTALSTSYIGETDTAYTYEATTPGFSTFAITATTRAGPAATTPGTPAGEQTKAAPTTSKPRTTTTAATGGTNTAMWVIVAIIVIAVVIGLVMKGKGKKRWY